MTATATETSTVTRLFAVGDEVTVNHPRFFGRVYVVAQVKRTKAIVKPKDQPLARGVDAPMTMLAHHDPNAPMPTRPPVRMVPIITNRVGEVVRLKRPFRNNTTETLMVVTNVNTTTLSLDPLGGQGGTPMRIAPSLVVKVPLADILR